MTHLRKAMAALKAKDALTNEQLVALQATEVALGQGQAAQQAAAADSKKRKSTEAG